MSITVYDLVELFLEADFQEIEIWNIYNEEVIFVGILDDMPLDIQDLTVQSIDNLEKGTNVLTINVDTEEFEF